MEYILIGKIVNTFGIKGELKVEVHTDFVEERYSGGSTFYIGDDHKDYTDFIKLVKNAEEEMMDLYLKML